MARSEVACRVCGCTHSRACADGCGWAEGKGNLCTTCHRALEALREWRELANRPSVAALLRELRGVRVRCLACQQCSDVQGMHDPCPNCGAVGRLAPVIRVRCFRLRGRTSDHESRRRLRAVK